MKKVIAVIPARLASTRLPEKPLVLIAGKPMVQWVYEAASKARSVDEVWVATDHPRVEEAVKAFGGQVLMTSPELASGTDRVAAVAEKVAGDIFVNVQGDEPLMDPQAIDIAVELVKSGRFPMGTVMTPFKTEEALTNPHAVKVFADRLGRAIYFSRLSIPYGRGPIPSKVGESIPQQHVGLYVYDRATLVRIRSLPVSPVEIAEGLEQLRALMDGIAIGIQTVQLPAMEVNTPEDLERVRAYLEQKRS